MKNIWITPLFLLTTHSFANSFMDDSKIELTARNFYFDRDYKAESTYPAAKDWAQGFIFKANSGFTAGQIGFGLDLLATTGFKLHGNATYAGTGNLPRNEITNEPAKHYGEIGLTGKVKLNQTEVRLGTLQPMTPVLVGSPARLLPQTYRGISLNSKEIENLEIETSFIDRVNHRDSTDYEKIKISGVNSRFKSAETDHLFYAGGYYNLNDLKLKTGLFHMDVNNIYEQTVFGLIHKYPFNSNTVLTTQLRHYISRDDGKRLAGKVENDLTHTYFELAHYNHKFIFKTFHHSGLTAFPYLTGGETGLLIDTWPGEFLNPKEKVYSFRYDYDFNNYIPGLRFMTRYTIGTNIYAPHLGGDNLKEDEFDLDLGYTIQTGFLKNLNLRGRYAIYDNNLTSKSNLKPVNETRINIDYTWKFK